MQDINSIFEQINDNNSDLNKIRVSILDLISNKLTSLKGSFGYWEKLFFSEAISSLALNINSNQQPNTSQLRLCLVNIEKALVPHDQRYEEYPPKDKRIKALTYEHFVKELKLLRQLCR